MDRYSRQTRFGPIGEEGQKDLLNAHVLIVGAGALGSWNIEMLARAGVGTISIVDRDYVEESNLQRQLLYSMEDVDHRMPKAIAAKYRVESINSDVTVNAHVFHADSSNLGTLVEEADLIMDGTDNFDTRFLINDLAMKYNKPWIFGACVGSYGSSFTIIPKETPCLQCLLQSVPMQTMTCDSAGIISPAVGQVVTHQVMEAIKILTGHKSELRNTYYYFDLWKNEQMFLKVGKARKKNCISCGEKPTYPYLQLENQTRTAVLCGRDTVQIRPPGTQEIDLGHVLTRLKSLDYKVEKYLHLISGEKNGERIVLFKDGRMLVHGTKDAQFAKSVYQKIFS